MTHDKAKEIYARGVDVSYFQGQLSWPQVIEDLGITFAFCRVSDGRLRDHTFNRNWVECGKYGLLRGAYHLVRPDKEKQAAFVFELLAGRTLELGVWADLEICGLTALRVERFLDRADQLLNTRVGIYSRANFLTPIARPCWIDRPLWIASPRRLWPVLPMQWTKWEFWQYGQANLEKKKIDLDLFHGTPEELQKQYGGNDESNCLGNCRPGGAVPGDLGNS